MKSRRLKGVFAVIRNVHCLLRPRRSLKKKVLYFTPVFPPFFSGATYQALTLARELRRRKWRIFFITLREREDGDGRAGFIERYKGFSVFVVPVKNYQAVIAGGCSRFAILRLIFRLLFVCFKLRSHYRVFHSHVFAFPFSILGILGFLPGKMTVGKVTMSEELAFRNIGRLAGKMHRLFCRSFDYSVAISIEIKESLLKIPLAEKKIINIPNSVDSRIFTPVKPEMRERLRQELKFPDGFIFIFVGGITYRKGVDRLVRSWCEFNKKYPATSLILLGPRSIDEGAVGDRYCYNEVVGFIGENNLSQTISMPGKVDNVHQFLQCADIFVFTSLLEGMANVVLEAMACGLPVISTPVSGIVDIIRSGENGEIIDRQNHDSSQLVATMEKLYLDKSLRKKYSRAGLAVIAEKFSLDCVASGYERLYQKNRKVMVERI